MLVHCHICGAVLEGPLPRVGLQESVGMTHQLLARFVQVGCGQGPVATLENFCQGQVGTAQVCRRMSGWGSWYEHSLHQSAVGNDLEPLWKIPATARMEGACLQENTEMGHVVNNLWTVSVPHRFPQASMCPLRLWGGRKMARISSFDLGEISQRPLPL